jgi:hypothetical protein
MINHYRDMWARWACSELLAPLSSLMSKNVKFQWTEIEQPAFEKIKNVVCWEVLPLISRLFWTFSYPYRCKSPTRCSHQSKPSSYSILQS